jgi:hypothetical protein
VQCGHVVCICPFVPEATVGRMAKELDLAGMDQMFQLDHDTFSHESMDVSSRVLDRVGGYSGLIERFPFDRGDTNKALVLLCIRIADVIGESDSSTAESLRGAAMKIGAAAAFPGSKRSQGQLEKLIASVRKMIDDLPEEVRIAAGTEGQSLEESVGKMAIPKIRVIAVFANPTGTTNLRLSQEDRAIRQAIQRGRARDFISLEVRHATTVDDLRHALLDDGYEVLHFSGHGESDVLVFENAAGNVQTSPVDAIASLVEHHPSIKCVILNACKSLSAITKSIADITVGMEKAVDDEAAIQFAQGFYDAVAAGKTYEFAIEEGKVACEMKGFALPLKILKR